MTTIKIDNGHREISIKGDGAHHGLTDWYEEVEKQIVAALNANDEFDTGWYSSKKACANGRITHYQNGLHGYILTCQARVTDDFDTNGFGEVEVSNADEEITIERVREVMGRAYALAAENAKENEVYLGFSIINKGWVETFLIDADGEYDAPPGDTYYKWGWQGECEIPEDIKKGLEAWAWRFRWGLDRDGDESHTIGEWTIQVWDSE